MTRLASIVLLAGLACACGIDPSMAQQGAAQDAAGAAGAGVPARQPAPPSPVPAQNPDAVQPAETGRYSFHRRGEDFVRLDSQTGQVSQCGWSAIGWSCKSAPDERTALESEIGRLQRENAALKQSLLSRGLDLPAGVLPGASKQSQSKAETPRPPADVPDASRDDSAGGPKAPGEEDLDRAMAYIKSVWRRLVEMMMDVQRDIQRKG